MKKEEGKSEFRILRYAFTVALCLACFFIGSTFYATEKKTVKVAFFPMDGYHIVEEDGTYAGMDVEYLNAICRYLPWSIEYVRCDSWEDALEKLENKEVDLVGSAQYSESRAQIFDYTDISSGYTFGVIATNSDNVIGYEDFKAMSDLRFGVVKNYVRKAEFLDYLNENGISNPNITEYATSAALQDALNAGEIDAYAHTFTEMKEGQRLIGRFAPRPFYYITYKGNTGILDQLNHAIVDLKMNQPELETELMKEYYYDKFDQTVVLTTEEKEYLAEKKVLRVGFLDNYYPFSYAEEGEFKGLSRELIESSLSITGIEIEYVLFENRQKAHSALMNEEIDIFAYSVDRTSTLKQYNIKSICDYVEVPLVVVTEKNRPIKSFKKIATVTFLEEQAREYIDSDNVELVTFIDQQACIDAVMNAEVDAIICNGYYAEHLMRTDVDYNNIQIRTVLNLYYSVSLAVNNDSTILSDILEKTVADIDSQMINEYMLKEVTYPIVTIIGFMRNHTLTLISILLTVFAIIMLVAFHMLADSRKIQKLMYKDSNMDVWNLNYFVYHGEKKLLPDTKNKYAVVFLNLSKFRRFNIIYGWHTGDRVLDVFLTTLSSFVDHKTEIYARNRGDRFVLLLNYKEEETFYERLKELKNAVESKIQIIGGDDIKLQIGVYFVPDKEIDLKHAVACANQALEFVDSNVGSNIKIYDESLQKMLTDRHEREKLLGNADVEKDFVAFYQPKVDIRDDRIVGAEALVRFKDPTDGGKIKSPYFFVPYYEQTGRITELDFFVYESVCKMLRKRMDAGLPVVPVSCNFSRMHFVKEGFADRFEEVLNRYNISKNLIEVEVTETIIMEEIDQATVKATFEQLKERNITLAIDDFGAGYSSLGIFEQIPASVVKMDRSFFLNSDNPERQVKIMRGIVTLSEELDSKVVCEGVESRKDVHLMEEIGAHVAQGYYYSKPIPEDEFEALLNAVYMKKQ